MRLLLDCTPYIYMHARPPSPPPPPHTHMYTRTHVCTPQICLHWVRQCFWNFLDWPEICLYLTTCIVMGTDYQASVMIIRCTVLFRATGSGVWLRCEDVCVKKLGPELRKPLFSFIKGASSRLRRLDAPLVSYMWQSRVENEYYSVTYFDRIHAFKAMYL